MREAGGGTVAGHLQGCRLVFYAERMHLGDLRSQATEDSELRIKRPSDRGLIKSKEGSRLGGNIHFVFHAKRVHLGDLGCPAIEMFQDQHQI